MDEPELSIYGTASIDEFAKFGNQPLGYQNWFIAAYPDVILWFQDIDDKKALYLLGNPIEDAVLDNDRKIKIEYLRKIIDAYNTTLECSILNKED